MRFNLTRTISVAVMFATVLSPVKASEQPAERIKLLVGQTKTTEKGVLHSENAQIASADSDGITGRAAGSTIVHDCNTGKTYHVSVSSVKPNRKGTNTNSLNGGSITYKAHSKSDALNAIGSGLKARKEKITVAVPSDTGLTESYVSSRVLDPSLHFLGDTDQFDINSLKVTAKKNGSNTVISTDATYAQTSPYAVYTEKNIGKILKKLRLRGSTKNRIRQIHDYVIDHVSYYNGGKQGVGYSEYNAAFEGKANCAGYTELFSDLCNRSGIQCRSVTGTTDDADGTSRHAWNLVSCNGKWYYVDTTWDDVYKEYDDRYAYFMQPVDKLWDDHHLDESYKATTLAYCLKKRTASTNEKISYNVGSAKKAKAPAVKSADPKAKKTVTETKTRKQTKAKKTKKNKKSKKKQKK